MHAKGLGLKSWPLYVILTSWVSLGLVGSSIFRYEIGKHIRHDLDQKALESTTDDLINSYSEEINKRWQKLTQGKDSECCNQKQLNALIKGIIPSHSFVIYLAYKDMLAVPKGTLKISNSESLRESLNLIRRDEDRFIGPAPGKTSAFAIAGRKLTLEGVSRENQPEIMIIMRWQLREALRESQNKESTLRFITLLVILSINWWFLHRALRPIRILSEKAKHLDNNNLLAGQLNEKNTPSEISGLVEAYNEMLRRMDHEFKRQKTFASNLSHEFRTPLTIICGYLESVLNRSEQLTDSERESLNTALQEAKRLNMLLSDLLDLSRADHKQLKLREEPFKVSDAICLIYKNSEKVFPGRLKVECPKTLESQSMIGDKARYIQVIQNLLENAVKYSPLDTQIILRIREDQNWLSTEIIDQGTGIPEDAIPHLFERFYRVKDSKQFKKAKSSGIGLSVVKSLVETMEGEVEVESRLNYGSCFRVKMKPYKQSLI